MSNYTTEIRFIAESLAGLNHSVGYTGVADIIEKSRSKIFSFPYPIFDENYRSILETKILKHYYTREIGAETFGLWQLWLDRKMNEIMPYYNQLYKSELLQFNPLYDYDLWRTHNVNRNEDVNDNGKITRNEEDTLHQTTATDTHNTNDISSNGESTANNTADNVTNNKDRYSETPQGQIHLLESMDYLTNARIIDTTDNATGSVHTTNQDNSDSNFNENVDSTTDGSTNRTGSTDTTNTKNLTSVEDYLEHVSGKMPGKTYSAMLQEYRQTFLNIDMQIINELNTLFMGLW